MHAPLKIYGVPNSQPVRAIVWVCLMQRLPFEFIMTSQNKAAKTDAFLSEVNPRGTIPAIDDNGLILWESHAILIYLAEKHGWHDLWPEDLQERARINQYLHFHHRNTREVVVQWSRTLWPAVFKVEKPEQGWLRRNTFPGLENNNHVVDNALQIIDVMLSAYPYLAGPSATLADIAAYEELGQNQERYANCTDFSDHPNILEWLERMAELPYHEEAHAIWRLIGDANHIEGGMQTIARANKEAARILSAASA
ncbi:MAG: glutathione S-transferase family protein [Pseudomonadota bacterium]